MISDLENESLVYDITPEEVQTASFSMHADKSPETDGLNIVGPDVIIF